MLPFIFVTIPEQHKSIIKHARKSLLVNGGKTWVKRQGNTTFDVTMGSYDGAEVYELVGLFSLKSLALEYENDNVGLYQDDQLFLLKRTSNCVADKERKKPA